MGKIKIADKGYTLKVVSWENDGDHYNTLRKTYQDKELAIAVAKMCVELFKSIGNSMDDDEKETAIDYMKKHPILITEKYDGEDEDDEDYDDFLYYLCQKYSWDLMGSSEYYDFRKCESVVIFYSPVDVMIEEIKF